MFKVTLIIILMVVMTLILFWRRIKAHIMLKICRRIFDYLMLGKK